LYYFGLTVNPETTAEIEMGSTMRVALHICCAVCAAGAAERLLQEGFSVVGYFYNPNLYPEEEYLRRLDNAQIAAAKSGFPLTEGPRDYHNWNINVFNN